MTHFLACVSEDGSVTVAADVPADYPATPPWVVVDERGLQAMRDAASVAFVPAAVTARQIRLWLLGRGVSMSDVDAAIDGIADEATRDIVRVEWEYAPYVERAHQMLAPLASALGLSEADIDQAFREAAAL